MTITRAFQRGETVPIWAEVRTWLDVAASPSEGLTVAITDPNEGKVGEITVSASASFTVGLLVTGGTSGATGRVCVKVDGTTLLLCQVTGTWESAEAITDTSTGSSTTTSALTNVSMTETPGSSGNYVYYYASQSYDVVGWWRYKVTSQDSAAAPKYTVTWGGFKLE